MATTAKDIMTQNVECVDADAVIPEVARKMKSLDVGFIPVSENDRVIGAITDRDIVLRVVAEDLDPGECEARDVMSAGVTWCYEDQSLDEVADLMKKDDVRRVLIMNRQKRLTGVISIGDLAQAGGEQEQAGETIKDIAQAPPQAA